MANDILPGSKSADPAVVSSPDITPEPLYASPDESKKFISNLCDMFSSPDNSPSRISQGNDILTADQIIADHASNINNLQSEFSDNNSTNSKNSTTLRLTFVQLSGNEIPIEVPDEIDRRDAGYHLTVVQAKKLFAEKYCEKEGRIFPECPPTFLKNVGDHIWGMPTELIQLRLLNGEKLNQNSEGFRASATFRKSVENRERERSVRARSLSCEGENLSNNRILPSSAVDNSYSNYNRKFVDDGTEDESDFDSKNAAKNEIVLEDSDLIVDVAPSFKVRVILPDLSVIFPDVYAESNVLEEELKNSEKNLKTLRNNSNSNLNETNLNESSSSSADCTSNDYENGNIKNSKTSTSSLELQYDALSKENIEIKQAEEALSETKSAITKFWKNKLAEEWWSDSYFFTYKHLMWYYFMPIEEAQKNILQIRKIR